MSELLQLIEKEIPDGRRSLQENYNNLENVAQYCQENYLQNPDKRKALEETKNFTTHSLASVAYQINNLATNFLKLLDLQQNQLAEMESNVNHLSQTVHIHKEKVARREIGVLTTNKSTTRPLGVKNGIIFPEHGERPTKYQRKPIDYGSLDDIGHGVKLADTRGLLRTQSTASTATQKSNRSGSVSSTNITPAPSNPPPTPPQGGVSGGGSGSLSRPSDKYRTPAPAVAPPTVPSHYASTQQMQQQQQQARNPYGQGHMTVGPTPIAVARPMSQSSMGPPASPGLPKMPGGGRLSQFPQIQQSIDLPPPPGSGNMDGNEFGFDGMPLPPPPVDQFVFNTGSSPHQPPPPPQQFNDDDDDSLPPQDEDPYAATGPEMLSTDWIPAEYLERVIAIYDYSADKADELSFSENSVIYVLKKNDDGWWEGTLNGMTGLFPGNYVEGCL